ncbi:MAG: agmatinase family protein [Myxococcales bacterium]|nr:agmatinase family protein [Myxococcales bacterium]
MDPAAPSDADEGIFGLPFTEDEASVVLLPVPWEPTTSYRRGTAKGPAAIRAASAQVDLFDIELATLGLARPWSFGIHMRGEAPELRALNEQACASALPVINAGGAYETDPRGDPTARELARHVARVDALSAELETWLYEQTAALLDRGKLVGVIGGDHSAPLGAIRALAERSPGLGILHIDAHADLRRAYEGFAQSHASIMDNVLRAAPGVARIVQVGVRDLCAEELELLRGEPRVVGFFEHSLRRRLHAGESWRAICEEIADALPPRVYVSFDIDGLDPALCPNTGTPVPGGLSWREAMTLLVTVVERGRELVGFDVVEVAPAPAPGDEWDGNVGARLVYRLCGLALVSQGARDEPPGPG